MIDIIETDQWTASGNMEDQVFKTVGLDDVSGGDSEAAKSIFGGRFERKQVEETEAPPIGNVWYKESPDGKCEVYKYNFDTSG